MPWLSFQMSLLQQTVAQTNENLRQSDTWTDNVQQSSLIDYKHNHNQYATE